MRPSLIPSTDSLPQAMTGVMRLSARAYRRRLCRSRRPACRDDAPTENHANPVRLSDLRNKENFQFLIELASFGKHHDKASVNHAPQRSSITSISKATKSGSWRKAKISSSRQVTSWIR